MRPSQAALPLLLAALSGCAHVGPAPEGETVEVEGWAPLSEGSRDSARERAVADARRKAVERVTGVSLEAESRVSNALSFHQNIRSKSAGHVATTEVLDEREEEGFLKVRVRARVLLRPPEGQGRRVALEIDDPALAAGVRQALAEAGLSEDSDSPEATVSGSAKSAALARSPFPGLRSARARALLTVRPKSGPERRHSGEASAVDVDSETAAEKAVESAGYLAGRELARALTGEATSGP